MEDNENKAFSKEYLMELLSILIDHIEENKEIYSAILANNRNGILIDFLIDAIEKDVSEKLKGNSEIMISDLPLDIIVKFYAGGLINIGIDCITRTKKYSKKELLLYIDKLIPDKIS